MGWLDLTEQEAYTECAETLEFVLETNKDNLFELGDNLQAIVNDIKLWQKHNREV